MYIQRSEAAGAGSVDARARVAVVQEAVRQRVRAHVRAQRVEAHVLFHESIVHLVRRFYTELT